MSVSPVCPVGALRFLVSPPARRVGGIRHWVMTRTATVSPQPISRSAPRVAPLEPDLLGPLDLHDHAVLHHGRHRAVAQAAKRCRDASERVAAPLRLPIRFHRGYLLVECRQVAWSCTKTRTCRGESQTVS